MKCRGGPRGGLLLLLAGVTGCGDVATNGSPWTRWDSGGVSWIAYGGERPRVTALEAPARVRLTEPGDGFGAVFAGALTGEAAYVLDGQAGTIYRYSRAGVLTNTIGSPGDGPGELRQPVAITAIGDTLLVADRRRGRVVVFQGDGTHLGGTGFPGPLFTATARSPSDLYVLSIQTQGWEEVRSSAPTVVPSEVRIVRLTEGETPDTIHTDQGPASIQRGSSAMPMPFQVLPQLRQHPRGVAFIGGGMADIVMLDERGPRTVFVWPHASRPVEDGEWEALREERMADAVSPASRQVIARSFIPEARPTRRPWAGSLHVDRENGRLWIQRAAPFYSTDSVTWRIDLESQDMVEIHLPSDATILAAHGDQVLLRRTDALGVHSVEVVPVSPSTQESSR